jgi:hypothetical protein
MPHGITSPPIDEKGVERSLTVDERTVLAVLDDEFMSASVIKIRSGRPSSDPINRIRAICDELERRGLAEHSGSGRRSKNRWRRVPGHIQS